MSLLNILKKNACGRQYLPLVNEGINPLHVIIEHYEAEIKHTADPEERATKTMRLGKFIAKAKETGDYFADYELWKQTISAIKQTSGAQEIVEIIQQYFHERRDADLCAHAMFLDPRIREACGGRLEHLYRAVLKYGFPRVHGPKEKPYVLGHAATKGARDGMFSEGLERLIDALPAGVFSKDDEQYTPLRKLLRKKANREAFDYFKKSPTEGIAFLEQHLQNITNPNAKFVYQDVLDTYRSYIDLTFVNENKEFQDSATGQKGVFPSLHQRIAVHNALERQRFGVLDGCGTGKTAIGALLFPLVTQKKQQEGKHVHNRMVVVGTIPCYKTWNKGFAGDERVRYLNEKTNVALINEDARNDAKLAELQKANVIFVNYQQLNRPFTIKGEEIPTYRVLENLGYDVLVFDEVHNIKNKNEQTPSGNVTASAAARHLAFNDPDLYFLLLSGTPMPDNLGDYAMIYHLLRPDLCKDPGQFLTKIKTSGYDPHALSSFVDDNTIRRTAEQINNLEALDDDDCYDDVTLTPLQRKIHNYLVSYRPQGWLMETRKALIDPRLVNKKYLEQAGITRMPTLADASKYSRLEQIASDVVARKEKFVVFSSILKDGITRMKSAKHGGVSLKESLEEHIKRTYGKDAYIEVIDGDVTSAVQRENIANRFRDDTNMVGIMCTTDTGGESLDFSFANNAIFLDEDYSPATTEQAIARLWRRGQSKQVHVKFLRGLGSIDASITEYVEKKNLAIHIALDGHPPTPEELALLTDNKSLTELTRMISEKFGGFAIDLRKYDSFSLSDVEVRQRRKSSSIHNRSGIIGNGLESTRAQEIGMRIGADKNCWHNEQFVAEYVEVFPELAPYLASRMRVLDVVGRAKRGEITFPKKVLSLGAGHGVISKAYEELSDVIKAAKMRVPQVNDLDFSKPMTQANANPLRILANMIRLPVKNNVYDFVDDASISLLKNPDEVLETLQEAYRVLKPGGMIELSVKNLYFKEGFHDALRVLGFAPITKPNVALSLSKLKYDELSAEHGAGFAASCKSKIDNWQVILAKKTGEPSKPTTEDLWFMTDVGSEYVPPQHEDVPAERNEHMPAKRKKGMRRPKSKEDVPKTNRSYHVNKDGTVDFE